MAKDQFGLDINSESTGAFVQAAKQSLRLMDGLAAHSALMVQMQKMSSAMALSSGLRESVALQTAAIERARATLPTLRMPEIPSSTAFMTGIQAKAAIEEANTMKLRSMLISPSITQAAVESLAAHRRSLQAAYTALRDNQALFSRSSEMLRAAQEGVAALRAMEAARPPSLTTVLQGIRLDQQRFNSIVESLATATIGDLGAEEAQGVAKAFEEVVAVQAGSTGSPGAAVATADQLVLEEFSDRLHEAVLARLPPQRASGSSIVNVDRLIAILALLLALATYHSGIEASKSDARNTREITSRQDENNELLRGLLEEFRRHCTVSVPRMRLVDRDARVFRRPAKGSSVIAVVPEGVQVAVVDVWGRWVEITYLDAAAEITRTGWVLKKYLE